MTRVLVYCMTLVTTVSGLVLRPCDQSGNVEVVDNTDFSFTCEEYSGGSVTWSYQLGNSLPQVIGTCGSSSCVFSDVLPTGFFILSYLTQASCRLTLTSRTTIRQFGGTYIQCGTSSLCQVDIVSPAVLPSNSLNFTTTQWNLQGSADVTSVYSSIGQYSCEWTETNEAGEKTNISRVSLSLAPVTSDTSVTQNRTGQCSFSKQLPSDPGTYTYTVVINPGNTQRTGTRTIVRPESPAVQCNPSGHVPENKDISCACRASNVGQPNGRLVWFRGRDINNPINAGIYGATSLVMTPQTLIREDHNRTYFHCDVEWIQNVTGQTYTVVVGYGPSQPTFTISNFTLSENQTLSLDCRADGIPTPSITLVHQDSALVSQSSPLLWLVPRVQCKDSGVYICTASNAMGPATQTNITVYVMCAPREVLVSSNPAERPVLNYQRSPVAHVFNMASYPALSSFEFTYIGPDMTSNTPELDVTDINLNVICQQKSRPLYIATCALIVENVTSATAAGFYRLTLTNEKGSGHFLFQVTMKEKQQVTDCPFPVAAVAGGVTAAGVLVAIALIVCVVLYRKYSGQKQNTSERPLPREQDDNNYTGLAVFEDSGSNSVNTYDTPLSRKEEESNTYTGLVLYEDVVNQSRKTIAGDTAGTHNKVF